MKIAIVLGTRPEIIKMAPVIRACQKENVEFDIIHTGQHYSYELDKIFFEELELPSARFNLEVGSASHGKQTGLMLERIESVLMQEKPDIVLVEGDTNSVLAGALAAAKLHIKVGHVEAGLRSYFRLMPEEINRVLADHISDILFAPTQSAKNILLGEGIEGKKIEVTGNTIVDAVLHHLELAKNKSLEKFSLDKGSYGLITLHRAENVDSRERLQNILSGFEKICEHIGLPLAYPIHPRTKKMMEQFNLKMPKGVKLMEPVGYLDFLHLQKHARVVLTDSGGVQEESCILQVPCITLRDNTERPETLEVGGNVLAGADPDKILSASKAMLDKDRNWRNPFGDGRAGEKIVKRILDEACD